MSFFITRSAQEVGIINPVVAVYTGLNGAADATVYDSRITDIMARLPLIKQEVLTKPEITGYRTLYANLGFPDIETAGERNLRLTEAKGFQRFGPLVDAYNIVSLNNVEGLGCHDVSHLPKDFTLTFKRALGDEKIFTSSTKSKKLTKGDLTYGVKDEIGTFTPFAQLGKEDRDNVRNRVNKDTQAMLLTAIGHNATSRDYNIKVCEDVFENLKLSSPDVQMTLRVGTFIEDHEA